MIHQKKVSAGGTVSIPVAIRRELKIHAKDTMDVTVAENGSIILSHHVPRCVFCESTKDVMAIANKSLCKKCIDMIHEAANGTAAHKCQCKKYTEMIKEDTNGTV